MRLFNTTFKNFVALTLSVAAWSANAQAVKITLAGSQEVPPVVSTATGSGTITVGADMGISGSVTTVGLEGTMAHIHKGAPGQNGPVVVPMVKSADNVWSIAAGAKLTEAQMQDFKDGNLYVNVHSAANKGGEIRAQLKP
jgi:hypothetical protein